MNNIKIAQLIFLGSVDFFFFLLERAYRFIDQDIFFPLPTLFFKLWSLALYLLPQRLERQEKIGSKNSWMELLIMIDKELHCVREKQGDLCVGGKHVTSCLSSARAVPFVSLLFWIFFKILIEPGFFHTPSHFPSVIVRDKKKRDPSEQLYGFFHPAALPPLFSKTVSKYFWSWI